METSINKGARFAKRVKGGCGGCYYFWVGSCMYNPPVIAEGFVADRRPLTGKDDFCSKWEKGVDDA